MRIERLYSLSLVPDRLLVAKGSIPLKTIRSNADMIEGNPDTILLGIYDEDDDNNIVGFMWLSISDLENALVTVLFSLDKKYQSVDGFNIKAMARVCRAIKEDMKLDKIYWTTTRPRAFEKLGFKRSRNVLMEAE
jgi:hypothetical protein